MSIVLVVAGINGCSDEVSLEDQMEGMWLSNLKGIYVAFNDDGTYGKGHSPEQAMGTDFESGTWAVDDGVLTFSTGEGFQYCSGTNGTYEVEVTGTGDDILVTLLDDTCDKRTEDFPSGLKRHTDSEA